MEIVPDQSIARTASGAGLHKGRSAVTNGKRLHVVKPGDTAWARRFRDVLSQIISDLGGYDNLSEGQYQMARRCTTIIIQCEKMEGETAAGRNIDLEQYGQLTDRLGRAFHRLHSSCLKRQARDVTPTLGDLLREDHLRQQQQDAQQAAEPRREFEAK
jgi:hypothetical protein